MLPQDASPLQQCERVVSVETEALFNPKLRQILHWSGQNGPVASNNNGPLQQFRMRGDELKQFLITKILAGHMLLVRSLFRP